MRTLYADDYVGEYNACLVLIEQAFALELVEEITKYISDRFDIAQLDREKLRHIVFDLYDKFGPTLEDRLCGKIPMISKYRYARGDKRQVAFYTGGVKSIILGAIEIYLNLAISLTRINEMSAEEAALFGKIPGIAKAPTVYFVYKYLKEHSTSGPVLDEQVQKKALDEIEKTEQLLKRYEGRVQSAVEMVFDYEGFMLQLKM